MGLIQDMIDSQTKHEKVKERSMLKKDKKETKIKTKINIVKRVSPSLEKGGRKVVRAGERISHARIKFRKGRISKGLRVQL